MWEVHYSQESATYLEDNGQLIVEFFFTMESLVESDGVPVNGEFQDLQNLFYWSVENHLVVYRRIEGMKIINIIFIKPE